eukprot:scaffold70849_cov21-Tisochrysis_lutea.AAC.1
MATSNTTAQRKELFSKCACTQLPLHKLGSLWAEQLSDLQHPVLLNAVHGSGRERGGEEKGFKVRHYICITTILATPNASPLVYLQPQGNDSAAVHAGVRHDVRQ